MFMRLLGASALGFVLACILACTGAAGKEAMADAARDYEAQYNLAADNGAKPADLYVAAGLCAEAWKQAGDGKRYGYWKDVERRHGRALGID